MFYQPEGVEKAADMKKLLEEKGIKVRNKIKTFRRCLPSIERRRAD